MDTTRWCILSCALLFPFIMDWCHYLAVARVRHTIKAVLKVMDPSIGQALYIKVPQERERERERGAELALKREYCELEVSLRRVCLRGPSLLTSPAMFRPCTKDV